jgi:anaerobic ribonucleoside-triphosphate reductase activating protein
MNGHQVRVAARVRDTEAEGPGRRWAMWVQGCPLRCPGCCNPELLPERARDGSDRLVAVAELADEALATRGIEGVSLLGGEPFAQAGPLAELARRVRAGGLGIMVYSGFTLAELRARGDAATDALLAATDLLVDGRYDREQPDTERRWIGSRNQVLHFLSDRYRRDDPRFAAANSVELRLHGGVVTINGWPAAVRQWARRS